MKKALFLFLIVAFCFALPTVARAQKGSVHGPFTVIEIDQNAVKDVITKGNDIYVRVTEPYWNAEFTVKISNKYMASYRQWLNGEKEMKVKVYLSPTNSMQGCTYRINTTAKFVEYWTGGRLVLHLERTR